MTRAILYKGKPVQLFPDTDITLEIEDDLLAFNVIGSAFSWPISIPRVGNEWIFNNAGDADQVDNLLKAYDGFQITLEGDLLWEMSFDLVEADQFQYGGSLTSVNQTYFNAKDKKLAELVTGAVTYSAGNYASIIGATNSLERSSIRWPWLHFYGQRWKKDPQVADLQIYQLANSNEIGMLLPCFTMEYVLKNILAGLGMQLANSFSDYSGGTDLFSNLLLIHNRVKEYDLSAGMSIQLSDHVPDMTLSELVQDLAIFTCSSVNLSTDQSTLEIRSIKKDINTSAIRLQLTNYPNNVPVQRAGANNLKLAWNLSADKRVEAATVAVLEGQNRGSFATMTEWMALSTPAVNDYGFIKALNQFYKVVDENGSLVSAFYSYPLQDYASGSTNQIDIKPKLLPAVKDGFFYQVITGSFQVTNSSGAIILTGGGNWTDFPTTLDSVQLVETNSEKSYGTGFFAVTAVNVGAGTITLSSGSYVADVQVKEIIIRTAIDAVIPIIGGGPHAPEVGQENQSFDARVVIWHGMVTGGGSTYPYASADQFDKAGTAINKFNLSWTAPGDNMVSSLFAPFISFIKQARFLKLSTTESIQTLNHLYRQKKARLVAGSIRIKKIKMLITSKGIKDQEVEGWKI
jgi:hypothetical protein